MKIYLLCFGVAAALVSFSLLWNIIKHFKLRAKMPPGPLGWPMIGSMLQLPLVLSNPRKFEQLVQRYGPIVTLWNGEVPTILISSREIAHEVLIHKGTEFASRLAFPSLRTITSGFKTINASPYGDYWRATRRNLVSGLLSPRMMSSFASIQEQAVKDLLLTVDSEAHEHEETVSVSVLVRRTLLRILSFVSFGRTLDDSQLDRVDSLMREAITMLYPGIGDLVPLLRTFTRRASQKRKKKLDEFLACQNDLMGGFISEASTSEHQCYVQTLLSLQETPGVELDLNVLVRELFIAGADTTTTCVEWALANLVNHPHVQQKIFSEIGETLGDNKFVGVDDLPKLSYLDAVVKETLRMHPPVYVTAPHAPTRDSKLAGYHIPEGSNVLVHLQSLNNDPGAWEAAEEFKPERFFCRQQQQPDLIAFGAGRRICPGRNLGMVHVRLILANLVNAFEWRVPREEKMIDLSPQAGFTVGMKTPLRACVSRREST